MNRTKALEVSRALSEIEAFECYIEEIEKITKEYRADCYMEDFNSKLEDLLAEELARRNKVLADMQES